jgi:hypothetical protein
MQIVTVLKSGGSYSPEHVERLYYWLNRAVRNYFDFVVITDYDKKVVTRRARVIPMVSDMRNWWAKLEMFRGDIPHAPVRWYMDLDVIPVRNFDDMVAAKEDKELIVLRDFSGSEFSTRMVKWSTDLDLSFVFTEGWRWYCANTQVDSAQLPTDRDKVFVEKVLEKRDIKWKYFQDVYPNAFVSFDAEGQKLEQEAKWVLFQSDKNPSNVPISWFVDNGKPAKMDVVNYQRSK